ncbi:MAG: hypothetical protein ACLFSG_08605 [Halothiobacillaceae bacterium]
MQRPINPWLVAGGLTLVLGLAGCSDDSTPFAEHDVAGVFSKLAPLDASGSPQATLETLTKQVADAPLAAVAALDAQIVPHDQSDLQRTTREAEPGTPTVTTRDCPLGGQLEERILSDQQEETDTGERDELIEHRSLRAQDCTLLLSDGRTLRLEGEIRQDATDLAQWDETGGTWQETGHLVADMTGTVPDSAQPVFVLSGEARWQIDYSGRTEADGSETWSGQQTVQVGRLEGLFVEASGEVIYGGWLDATLSLDLAAQSIPQTEGTRIRETGSANMAGRFGSQAMNGYVVTTTPTTVTVDFDSDRDTHRCPASGVIRHEGATVAQIRYGADVLQSSEPVEYQVGEAVEGSTACDLMVVLLPIGNPFPDLRF